MPMGGTELLIILAIILLFFGAKKIPELARSLGRGTREFREGISEEPEGGEAEARSLREGGGEKPSTSPHAGRER